ncbi:MAG: transposase [Vulcanimicrobiota bacterium]
MGNVLKEIFTENWVSFKKKYPAYDMEYYDEVVNKMLGCGVPTNGFIEYRCIDCWEERRIIPFSCKCTFCLTCGKVYADNFAERVGGILHPGVVYRHLILTIPDDLNILFYQERHERVLLDHYFMTGWECIQDVMKTVKRKEVLTGCIMVLHIAGRSGNYRPHLHVLMIDGGIERKGGEWLSLGYLPYDILHKKWQYHLLTMLRGYFDSLEAKELIARMWKNYPKGFVANIKKGEVPRSSSGLAKYLAKYVSNPTISLRRIIRYDRVKGEVEYVYKSHKTKKMETEKIDVCCFIGRLVQQILPKGFQRIRYYGLQATKTFEKVKDLIASALMKIEKAVNDGYKVVKKVLYRDRYECSSGRDPFRCSRCGGIMDLWKIWIPKYGVIFDEEQRLRDGFYGIASELSPKREEVTLSTLPLSEQLCFEGF